MYESAKKGKESEFTYMVCENLGKNVMKYFSEGDRRMPTNVFLVHASRLVGCLFASPW